MQTWHSFTIERKLSVVSKQHSKIQIVGWIDKYQQKLFNYER